MRSFTFCFTFDFEQNYLLQTNSFRKKKSRLTLEDGKKVIWQRNEADT